MKNYQSEKSQQKLFFFFKLLNWYYDRLFISKIMAIVSVLNFGLVIFDLTYIPLRDIWLNGQITLGQFKLGPYEYNGIQLTVLPKSWRNNIIKYDVIKGIEPYRDTNFYLEEVDLLEESINQYGLKDENTEKILKNLREMSINMIREDPFRLANKSGTLEIIKNRMKEHMDNYINNPESSSTLAFTSFWTVTNLENNLSQQLSFFNEEIRPLINTNYYRPIGENGQFVNYFGLIDFPFIVIIFIDFVIRCLVISFRFNGVKIQDAIFWRWYDLIFFLPDFRWMRIVPITIRLNQSRLLTYQRIKKQISQGFVAGIAGDITQIVMLRIVNQVQKTIEKGQIEKVLFKEETKEYIDLNDTNEIAEVIKLLINLVAYEMLPEIRREVETLLAYIFQKTITESPIYQNIEHLPGLKTLPENISNKLAIQSYQIFLNTIDNMLKEDPIFENYLEKILEKATKTLNIRPNARYDINKIEELLVILLEEVKVNYIQNLSEDDIEALLDETRAINNN
ncbi:hypothetical protein [Geminocystis sp. NIES-3709]|uniref:hypothetical protein n=1 Tax=Geminocystis sp. NIES-3709 TaxID=1617448 RepID=UPI0005FCCD66|nr:hypothetical protein [Geminocystis sp. NIES-3709]BAQ63746.1 uridine phosphorylase [Geminocystis sp. NIES-3709]